MNDDQHASVDRHPGDRGQAASGALPTFTPYGAVHGGPPGQRAGSAIAERLLRSHLELGALATAPGSARAHTRMVLAEWGLGELADISELLVSELTTNAVRASRALPLPLPSSIHLWLRSDRQRVVVTVWDADAQPPVLKDGGVDVENGRGLQIVAALSAGWGWYQPERVGGKCVWCELACQPCT